MCLIVLSWRVDPAHPLIVAANRDEFHARAAEPAAFWKDNPAILAGRDLEAGGTWMGVSRSERFAAVTNYRGGRDANAAESRGALVAKFLLQSISPEEYVSKVKPSNYSGFNLLLSDGRELWWLSNRDGGSRRLEPGVYGLGNLLLDTPEVEGAKADFKQSIGVSPAVESLFLVLSKAKIVAPDYGTRCQLRRASVQPGRRGATNGALRIPADALELLAHVLVQDIGVLEHLALGLEALLAVELGRLQLRREHDFLVPLLARLLDERVQDQRADALPAPLLDHRHAPDVPVGQEAARADRLAGIVERNRVGALNVLVVELDAGRNVLLADEDGEADRAGDGLRLVPGHDFDSRHGPKV